MGRSIKEQLVGNDERVRVTSNRLWNDGDDLHPQATILDRGANQTCYLTEGHYIEDIYVAS